MRTAELMKKTLTFAALAFLSACSTASSTDIKTSGMHASISGLSDGTGTTAVSATLRVGAQSTTFIELASTDALKATSGADSVKLTKFELLGLVSYNGSLTGDEEGKSVTVALTRASPDVSAPTSTFTMPAKFQLTGPAVQANFKRGADAIEVKWDNGGKADPMTVDLTGTCIDPVSKAPATDTGSLVISGSELKASKDNETKSCNVTIVVRRTRAGTVDSAYGQGGLAVGIQTRQVIINSTP